MSYATVPTSYVFGPTAIPAHVEVHVADGLPGFSIVDESDGSTSDVRDRVRAALLNSGAGWPIRRITVNITDRRRRTTPSSFDLPVAVGILVAAGQLPASAIEHYSFVGELGLDGSLRHDRFAYAHAEAMPTPNVVVPRSSVTSAALCPEHNITGFATLTELVAFFSPHLSKEVNHV